MTFFRTLTFLALSFPLFISAQNSQKLARRIETVTGGSMRLASSTTAANTLIVSTNKGYLVTAHPDDKSQVSTDVRQWLEANIDELFAFGEGAELHEFNTERVANLWQSSFELTYNGIPVRERYVKVNTGALTGAVMMIRSNGTSAIPNTAHPLVTGESVTEKALTEISGSPKQIGIPQLVYVEKQNTLQIAYEVVAGSPRRERWRLTYDALTGSLIEKKSVLIDRCFESDGLQEESVYEPVEKAPPAMQTPQGAGTGRITALVHPETPTDAVIEVGLPGMDITINGVTTKTDSIGYWSLPITYPAIITTGLQNAFLNVAASGFAVSNVIDTILSGPSNIVWNDKNSTASERDAMYSLLRTRAHIKSIEPNLQNIDESVHATVDYDASCNAFYDPDDHSLTFFAASSSCNASARVADVVYHEFGHRVNHCHYLGTDAKNMQDLSLNEGFADIYSALLRDDPRIGRGFYTNPSQIMRNCDNTKKWPTNINPDSHVNGMIISGAFWDLRKSTNLETARHLFHTMSRLTPDGTGGVDAESLRDAFTNVLVATILADDDDNDLSNGTPHLTEIISSFEKHNVTLAGLLKVMPLQIADQDAATQSYLVKVKASYTAPVGALDESSVILHYSTNGKSFTTLPLTKSSDDLFEGTLPKVPSGSIVYYYASAATTLGHTNETPSKNDPMQFLVGFKQKFSDDFETDKGWVKTDSATTGRWERGEPFGTSYSGAEGHFIQQDTDHSPTGTLCYVTGNANTSNPSVDDVDNGFTRLTSPPLDLANTNDPYIRYWYYFSNDMGQNPGFSEFAVEVSTDNNEWSEVVLTTRSTDGWQQALIRVKDYVTPNATVRIRFIASDIIGSLVEAGIDDVEVLDALEPESVVGGNEQEPMSLEVYPQPIVSNQLHFRLLGAANRSSTISLKDLLGVERLKATMGNQHGDGELLLPSSLQNGVYMLEAHIGTQVGTAKIVLMR